MPEPVNATLCVPLALETTLSSALRTPLVVGANVTLIEQLAPTANVPPTGHVVVRAKSPALVPASAILGSARLAVPKVVS